MKCIVILCLAFMSLKTFGQVIANRSRGVLPLLYVVDGVPLNETAANIFKDKDIVFQKTCASGNVRDTVYITLKDHRKLQKLLLATRLSLAVIAVQNIADITKSSSILFFRNDTLLTDTAGIKISKLRLFKTEVLRARKTSYYGNFPETTFLYIYTNPVQFYVR